MVVKLLTYNKSSEVELQLLSNYAQKINVVGYDKNNQKYFDRNVIINEPKITLRFGCPKTPKELFLKINTNSNKDLKVIPNINPLGKSFIFSKKTNEFVDFVQEFCTNYWKYKTQKCFYSRNKTFKIVHYKKISANTPARIHKTKHFIEVGSDYFAEMTIPMRVFVLCHEYAHIYMNDNPLSEFEADINGAKLYLKLNYPIIELLYSFTKIFGDNEMSHKRAVAITNFVKKYD
tara:strand:+ start:9891 stop:10589 length:699 start_codon:yes stop_codon:yes gene_type:complete